MRASFALGFAGSLALAAFLFAPGSAASTCAVVLEGEGYVCAEASPYCWYGVSVTEDAPTTWAPCVGNLEDDHPCVAKNDLGYFGCVEVGSAGDCYADVHATPFALRDVGLLCEA